MQRFLGEELRGSRRAAPAWALAAIVAALPQGASAEAVLQMFAGRAYLDRGAADGLAVGQLIPFLRNGRAVGTCALDEVSDHFASCLAPFALKGDAYRLAKMSPAPPLQPRPVSPLPASVVSQQQAVVEAASLPMVESKASPSGPGLRGAVATAELAHASYATLDGGGGSFHQERLDLELRGLSIAQGFRAFVSLSALRWTRPDTTRFRPGAPTELYVREGQVSSRELGQRWGLSAGRVQPFNAPGLFALDGVQGGWRNVRGTSELGLFGGVLPDVVTMAPTARVTAGAYWGLSSSGGEGDGMRLLRHEGRVSFLTGAGLSQRVEAEGLFQAWLSRTFDASADLKLATGGQASVLQAARVDFGARPSTSLRISGGYRYTGERDEALIAIDPIAYGGRSHHADLTGAWDLSTAMTLSLTGGLARDVASALGREYVGPELSLSHLFGDAGGLSLSYLEELGWAAGRTAAAQTSVRLFRRVQLIGRLSYFQESPQGAGSLSHELGLFLYASAPLTPWLSLKLSALGRVPIDWAIDGAVTPAINVSVALAGAL
jgi:hypothetical protein